MKYFQLLIALDVVWLLLTTSAKQSDEKGASKKQIVMVHPKPHQSAIVLYGNEGSGQGGAERETLNALATNVETVTNLVKAQSEIIENLSHQVSSATKGTGNEQKFQQVFDEIANHASLIKNVTKRLNVTVKHVNELAGVWSASTVRINKELKDLEKEREENEDEIEDLERKLMEKIEKLQEEVKTLRVSLNYAHAESASNREEWPNGSYCILANGRCPKDFKRHHGHLKSLYLYSSSSQFVNDSKFGSSSIGCYGNYCGEYGNFIGALTLVTCCK